MSRAIRDPERSGATASKISIGDRLKGSLRKFRAPKGEASGEDDGGAIDIVTACERLIAFGVDRAAILSPQGSEGAAAAILMAREISDSGLKVLLLDLTTSGEVSVPMLESRNYPGITDLLCDEARLTDVIHGDLYSGCHIIPVGNADAARAMRAGERLPFVLDTLNTAYDVLIVECGPAPPSALRMVVARRTQLVLNVDEANAAMGVIEADLRKAGYHDLMKVTPILKTKPQRA